MEEKELLIGFIKMMNNGKRITDSQLEEIAYNITQSKVYGEFLDIICGEIENI